MRLQIMNIHQKINLLFYSFMTKVVMYVCSLFRKVLLDREHHKYLKKCVLAEFVFKINLKKNAFKFIIIIN